ncbi:ThiF family adenylyltransferase, partial [Nonomuraea zeae]|uniref:ThiF family adenylyltransferase n=1 Tax=Nonomuraea zeae TaxID=1642303 RepID=UPI00197D1693
MSGLTQAVRQWIEGLDGTRELDAVLEDAQAAGLDEIRAQFLLEQLAAQGALHDAATSHAPLHDLPLAERDRLRPDLDALDLASTATDGGIGMLLRRREKRVRVYGAGRVGAQVIALLAASGVGNIRVIDPGLVRPGDITPGGLTWAEVGLTREVGAVAVVRRLTSGGQGLGEAGGREQTSDTTEAAATGSGTRPATGPGSTRPGTPAPGPRSGTATPVPRAANATAGRRNPTATASSPGPRSTTSSPNPRTTA